MINNYGFSEYSHTRIHIHSPVPKHTSKLFPLRDVIEVHHCLQAGYDKNLE